MIEWTDIAKLSAGAMVAVAGFVIKDYWEQRTGAKNNPTMADCLAQHTEHAKIHAEDLFEKKAMRRATIQILLMMHPICVELLRKGVNKEHEGMDCDALHRCISELSE